MTTGLCKSETDMDLFLRREVGLAADWVVREWHLRWAPSSPGETGFGLGRRTAMLSLPDPNVPEDREIEAWDTFRRLAPLSSNRLTFLRLWNDLGSEPTASAHRMGSHARHDADKPTLARSADAHRGGPVDEDRLRRYAEVSRLLDEWANEPGDYDERMSALLEEALRETAPRHFPDS